MKTLVIFTILSILSFSAFSQRRVTIGFSAGGGKCLLKTPAEYKGTTTIRGAIVTDIRITKAFSIQPEAGINSYSTAYAITITNAYGNAAGETKSINRFMAVEIPILLKVKVGETVKPYYCFGAGPSFLISAKNTTKGLPGSSGAKADVSDYYNPMYLSMYNVLGFEGKGEKVIPFIEFRYQYSLTKLSDYLGVGTLNNLTANLGFRF